MAQNPSDMEDGTCYIGLLTSSALVLFNTSSCLDTEQMASLTTRLAMVEEHLQAAASIVNPLPTKREPHSGQETSSG